MLSYLKSTALLLSILLVGCASPVEFQSKHDHDTVVKFASRRTDNKRQGTAWAKVLESSFAQANQMDLRKIEEQKALNTAEAWERIHAINLRIEKRQARVEPLLPIVTGDGYRPDLRLLPVDEMLAESRQAVIDRYLVEIEDNLQLAREGQKAKARKAFDRIYMLRKKYRWAGEQSKELEYEALALGRTYVLVNMTSPWHFYNSNRVFEHMNFSGIGNNEPWQVIHLSPQPGIEYDYRAELEILDMSVSPEQTSSSCTTYSKEVEVGKEEVKDTNGVVVSYKPIYQTVTATVTETRVWKDASLTAQLEVFSIATGKNLLSRRIWETDSYSATSCSATGDARAFSGCCSSTTFFVPSDWSMMNNCTDDLRFTTRSLICQVDLEEL